MFELETCKLFFSDECGFSVYVQSAEKPSEAGPYKHFTVTPSRFFNVSHPSTGTLISFELGHRRDGCQAKRMLRTEGFTAGSSTDEEERILSWKLTIQPVEAPLCALSPLLSPVFSPHLCLCDGPVPLRIPAQVHDFVHRLPWRIFLLRPFKVPSPRRSSQ